MVARGAAWLLALSCLAASTLLQAPLPAGDVSEGQAARSRPALHGRFLHITDIHPDPHYIANTSVDEACHWRSSRGRTTPAGYWGTPNSDCDSPTSLVNATFEWLAATWAGHVDFVIWTGDSARHDLDSRIPRSFIEIVTLNGELAKRMVETFGPDTPIIPSVGNNDLYPHNIMFAGPSAVINSLQTIWRDMMPESEFHTFARGAYFSNEVVPGLVVVSLNTLYFFKSNKVVEGCPTTKKGRTDPGTEQLAWLETQLHRWRSEGKQVWLSGHVPPSHGLWYEKCDARYRELAIAYQDTILGHMYGHVNIDYFFFANYGQDVGRRFGTTASAKALEEGLRSDFGGLPKVSKLELDDYAVFHVSPSVVPTYQPTVRIYTYNITATTAYVPDASVEAEQTIQRTSAQQVLAVESETEDEDEDEGYAEVKKKKKRKKKKDKAPPRIPRHASAVSPSRMNRYLTPLGYSQWMIPLDDANAAGSDVWPEWSLEYTTYSAADLERFMNGRSFVDQPSPFPWINASGAMPSLKGKLHSLAPYGMEDLTVTRWLDLAHRLGKSRKKWKGFRKRMFVDTVH